MKTVVDLAENDVKIEELMVIQEETVYDSLVDRLEEYSNEELTMAFGISIPDHASVEEAVEIIRQNFCGHLICTASTPVITRVGKKKNIFSHSWGHCRIHLLTAPTLPSLYDLAIKWAKGVQEQMKKGE